MVEQMKKAAVDAKLERWVSRKLLAWLVTTILFVIGMVDADAFLMVTTAYVGTQGFVDAIIKWKSGSSNKE